MIIKKNSPVKVDKLSRAKTIQQLKYEKYQEYLKKPKMVREKYPPHKAGERYG